MQGQADIAVLYRKAKGPVTDLTVIEMQEQRRVIIGYTDFRDRFGIVGHMLPGTDLSEQGSRAIGQCGNPAIMFRGRQRLRLLPLHHYRAQTGAGKRQGLAQADHAAADDQDIRLNFVLPCHPHHISRLAGPLSSPSCPVSIHEII